MNTETTVCYRPSEPDKLRLGCGIDSSVQANRSPAEVMAGACSPPRCRGSRSMAGMQRGPVIPLFGWNRFHHMSEIGVLRELDGAS